LPVFANILRMAAIFRQHPENDVPASPFALTDEGMESGNYGLYLKASSRCVGATLFDQNQINDLSVCSQDAGCEA
jgi:hypothetical protein